MAAEDIISFLNQTIRQLSSISGKAPTKEAAKLIASGIYKSIEKRSIAREFEQYCQAVYDIDILI